MQTIDLWTHGGLFSGIGGFDLAAGWNDIENIFHCEVNPFSQYILKHYWPNSIQHDNVETADFTIHRGKIRILSGGFPCQDNSNANQSDTRKSGLQGLRTGLAFHMLRAVDEIRPEFVVPENVGDFLTVNGGKDFRTILGELAGMGYNAEWRICRSSDVGAPHHRERLYIVAYPNSLRMEKGQTFFSHVSEPHKQITWIPVGTPIQTYRGGAWSSEPPFPVVDYGFSDPMAGFTASQWRREAIKAFGNAVSPQIPNAIFKGIKDIYNLHHTN
jgi:DNA-cytosine methyltransferase